MKNFAELILKFNELKATGLPYVVYRKPHEKKISLLSQTDRRLQFAKNYKVSGFIMAPFRERQESIIFSSESITCDTFRYDPGISGKKLAGSDYRPQDQVFDEKAKHLDLVRHGVDFIAQSEVTKVVLSRKEILALDDFDATAVFEKLLLQYPGAFVYLWFHPDVGLWAGASPETLLRVNGKEFHTMALAGTRPWEESKEVVWGEKEKIEQQIVTDQIIGELKGLDIMAGPVHTKRAGNLLHICTNIQGEMDHESDLGMLIEKLHPTAAVCGLPKNKAREFILSNEGYDREFYTGFIGELNFNGEASIVPSGKTYDYMQTHLFVNLRCMRIIQEPSPKALLFIGGGITSGSIPEQEWEETVEKSKVMKSVLFND